MGAMNPFPLHVLICVVYFITVVFCRKGISKMKSIFIVRVMSLMAVGLSLFMGAANAAVDSNKEVIGIMDLKAEGDLKSASGILSDRLRAELFNTGRFAVMERGEMDAILKEQGFQQSGVCDDKACMVEIGQLLGASKMVAGSIGMLGTVYLINLRIIDVSTGKLVDTYSGECRCRIEDLGGAMKTLPAGQKQLRRPLLNPLLPWQRPSLRRRLFRKPQWKPLLTSPCVQCTTGHWDSFGQRMGLILNSTMSCPHTRILPYFIIISWYRKAARSTLPRLRAAGSTFAVNLPRI